MNLTPDAALTLVRETGNPFWGLMDDDAPAVIELATTYAREDQAVVIEATHIREAMRTIKRRRAA